MFNKKAKSARNALPSIKCAICGIVSEKATSFFCGSGHAVCKECQITDIQLLSACPPTRKNAGGDNNSESKVLNWDTADQKPKKKVNMYENKINLASGDHEEPKKSCRSKTSSKKNLSETLETVFENKNTTPAVETAVTYKNSNYCESKSSGSSSLKTSSSSPGKVLNSKSGSKCSNVTFLSDFKICTRPVLCPEYKCGKMIAMENTAMHFKFDHSKLPRIVLCANSPQQFLLNSTKLSMNTRCLALMSIENDNESVPPVQVTKPLTDDSSNEIPLLLMGVRMRLQDLMTQYDKTTHTLHKSSSEFRYKDSFLKELKPTNLKGNDCDDYSLNEEFHRTEVLLLWVCKAEEVASNYSITLLSGDQKHGHSYIGETISIREPQDPVSMYHRSECFTLRGVAANRLLDDKHRILVLITII